MPSSPNARNSNVSGVAPDPSLNLNSIFPAVYFDGPDSKSSPFKLSKRLSSESIKVILDLSGKVSIINVDPDGFDHGNQHLEPVVRTRMEHTLAESKSAHYGEV